MPSEERCTGRAWVEGDNLVIEYRYGGEDYERLAPRLALAKELVRLKVDVILAASAPSAQGAKGGVGPPPPSCSSRQRPGARGSWQSFARPGSNMTGQAGLGPSSIASASTAQDNGPTLSAAAPGEPDHPMTAQRPAGSSRRPPRSLRSTCERWRVRRQATRRRAAGDRPHRDGRLDRPRGPDLNRFRKRSSTSWPTSGPSDVYLVRMGGTGRLMEYTPDTRELYSRAAIYVDRICGEASPATCQLSAD